MDLYLIRHAEAGQRNEASSPSEDAERPLTVAGEEQSRALAAGLQRQGVRLEILVTSPLLRAQQTAEGILHAWAEPQPEIRVCEHLAPDGKRKRLARFLRTLQAGGVGLVGHMPDLGEFGGWLLGHRRVPLQLAKAGVALIRCPDPVGKGGGELVWMITPEWLGAALPRVLEA